MYGKHFLSMYQGSMLGAGAQVFAVWGWIISHVIAGSVEANPKVIAFEIGMREDEVSVALEFLQKPDPSSRNPDCEGRRIVKEGAFQYRVVSHEIYRNMRTQIDRTDYMRTYMRNRRSKPNKSNENVNSVNSVSSPLTVLAHTDTDTDTEQKHKKHIARSVSPEELAGTLPLISNKEYPVSKTQIAEWQTAFPGINVKQELMKFKQWCVANPEKKKTERGIARAIFRWLDNAQNYHGGKTIGKPDKHEQMRRDDEELFGADSHSVN